MNWLNKLPNSVRSASGLEWRLWRKLPLIAVAGTVLPLLVLAGLHWWRDDPTPVQERWLQMADFMVFGLLTLHWTLVFTVAIGCVVVMLMKGPGYVADGLPVSHSDKPRKEAQADDAPRDG